MFRTCSLFLLLVCAAAQAQQRPNFILIYSDDHAAHAVSAYRQHLKYAIGLPATPNIDRIARDGLLFTNAFVTNSLCGPARAAVLTGQYGHLTGVMTNADSLHPTVTTFPKLLQRVGYQTAIFGKWHLKERPSGFTRYEIMPGQGSYYNPLLVSASDSIRHTGYSQEIITDRALGWIEQQEQPFFAMISFNAPHRWWEPGPDQLPLYRDRDLPEPGTLFDNGSGRVFRTTDVEMTIALDLVERDLKLIEPDDMNAEQLAEWRKWYDPENAALRAANLAGAELVRWKYQRFIQDYMRAVAGIDAAVGRVLERLPANTIVIYSSDQGFFLGDHGWFDKRWMYEESIRTPLLIKWPGVIKPGSVNEMLVMNLDLAPTLLELAGASADPLMQGLSLVPLLRGGKTNWRDAIYYQYFAYPDWHMVRRQYGVRDAGYKLIHFYEVGEWELFDLAKDPHELRSVYADAAYEDVVARMKAKLATLRAQYAVPEKDRVPYTEWQ
ncbi:MAG: sulfatase family protein, partial [Gemmatimonadota bacterium]